MRLALTRPAADARVGVSACAKTGAARLDERMEQTA